MHEKKLPDPRSPLKRSTALQVAEEASPQVVHAFPSARNAERTTFWSSFWKVSLVAVPILVALVSTSLLAYFMLRPHFSQTYAQLPREQPAPNGPDRPAEEAPAGIPQLAQNGPQQPAPQQVQPEQVPAGRPRLIQDGPQQPAPQKVQPEPAPTALPAPMPSDEKLLMLVMSTLVALNQANATSNYTVLRDMGSPSFQEANSAARLAEIFAKLRERKLDLSPILVFQPKLARKPEMSPNGMVRVTGFFPTAPERVDFDLIFEPVGGEWRLYGISAGMRPAPTSATAEQPTPAPAPAAASVPEPAPPKPAASAAAASAKPASTAATPAAPVPPAGKPPADVRNKVDQLETSPRPATKPKPKENFNPLNPF